MVKGAEWGPRYQRAKESLFKNSGINESNKKLFREFFKEQEYKLQRLRGLRALDTGCFRTLYGYVNKLKICNRWFKNKPFIDLTAADIQRVYDGLEDGKILTPQGNPYRNLEDSYYSKIFKSTLFEMAGKLDLAKQIIKYRNGDDKEVRFITETDFRKLLLHAYKPHHRLLFWLAWDIGENINSLLYLRKSDFYLQKNPHTKEPEYRINLRREILKRSRKARAEITNYSETVELLDQYLQTLDSDQELFDFDYGTAKKIIDRAVERSKIKCSPRGEKPTWKDLRSGMSCDLLKKGWSSDEVNARLGHKPSSSEIDKYINFLAIDRHQPKKKVHQYEIEKLHEEVNEMKQREKVYIQRNEELQNKVRDIWETFSAMKATKLIKKYREGDLRRGLFVKGVE